MLRYKLHHRARTKAYCTDLPATLGQTIFLKPTRVSAVAVAAAIPATRHQTYALQAKASHEGARRSSERQKGCRAQLPRNMNPRDTALSRSIHGRRKMSGIDPASPIK